MATPHKYNPGDVIDIRFTNCTMPDRIFIQMVYKKSASTEWMYQVLSEQKDDIMFVSESQIDKAISKKDSKCYEHPMVKELYKNGFRFCGNNKEDNAFRRANNMKNAKYIKHIILAEAIDKDGKPIDGYLGLWVQYNTTITGGVKQDKKHNHYVIK